MQLFAAVLSAYIGLFLGGLSGVPDAGAAPVAAVAADMTSR